MKTLELNCNQALRDRSSLFSIHPAYFVSPVSAFFVYSIIQALHVSELNPGLTWFHLRKRYCTRPQSCGPQAESEFAPQLCSSLRIIIIPFPWFVLKQNIFETTGHSQCCVSCKRRFWYHPCKCGFAGYYFVIFVTSQQRFEQRVLKNEHFLEFFCANRSPKMWF